MSLCLLFLAKMADNALSTVKTIMIQRNRSLLAGVAIALSSFLYFWITRSVVLADSLLTTLTVAVASGVGCFLVSGINNKLSKDRTYVNVVMSDDMLNISNEQMSYITNADAGCGLIKYGSALVPFINRFPQNTKLYELMTTRPGEGQFAHGQE